MNSKLEKMARTGYVAKAVVYGITGILTFLAAFNMGGQKAGKIQVIEFLQKQDFGSVLLILMAIGLLCYASWKFIQAVRDPENIGADTSGKLTLVGFFFSGLVYSGLAVYAIMQVLNIRSSTGTQGGSSFLTGQVGVFVFVIVGIALAGTAISHFKRAYTESFLKKFDYKSITEEKRRKTIKNTGKLGLSARGILFGILSFFFIKAAIKSNTGDIKSTIDAFSFLQQSSYGSYLLGGVALGLIGYSIYMVMMAKYRKFKA